MSRYVWPYVFTLRVAGLVEATRQQRAAAVRDKYFPQTPGAAIPVALRWCTTPDLGFPREPFQVFRRQRHTAAEHDVLKPVIAQPVAVAGQQDLNVFAAGDAAYVVTASVTVSSGSLTLQALDALQRPIPGQAVTVSGNGQIELRCPGICSVRATGTGTVGPVSVIAETAYANLPDWQKIQTVGLPLANQELGASYNTTPQGFEPPVMDGVQAAEVRTAITAQLQVDPPGTGIPDFPLPPWPVPDPAAYVAALRDAKSLVPMIGRCLKTSVDADPTRMQADYAENVTLAGVKQANLPGAQADPAKPTKAHLPIPGVAMMAVSTDSYAAVSLGYGTVDIPPLELAAGHPAMVIAPVPVQPLTVALPRTPAAGHPAAVPVHPPIDAFSPHDYMVTAPFTVPWFTVTLAALSTGQPPVEGPAGLTAAVKHVYAPVQRNTAAPAAVRVSWQPSAIPQGYGLLASRAPHQSEVLNAPRPAAVKGCDPFVGIAPTKPDPHIPPDQQTPSFSDTACTVPLKGPAVQERYLVAGLDVFGLWSAWSLTSASLSPAPITKPGVRSVDFLMDTAAAIGHSVPATLRIEFAWDWQDRAPGQVRFTGQFVPPKSVLGPAFLGGLAMKNGGPVGAPAILTFNYASQAEADSIAPLAVIPTIDGGHTTDGPVRILTPPPYPNSRQVQYRVDIKDVTLDFSSVEELDFALYVTATEEIRPGEWSDPAEVMSPGTPHDPVTMYIGKVVRVHDPIPPTVTFTPPAISWTALPDATGTARGILEWTADPKAAGYYVWEATESALRHVLAPETPDPPPNTPLVNRGASLKAMIQANQEQSLQGFARLNKAPIPGTRTEIHIPAAASTLYVYRISAISAGNVEASRSNEVAIFGVPRRNVPGVPRLLLRPAPSPQIGIQVIVLPVESGAKPAGYRIFRVRRAGLSLDGSTMGPAKIDETHPGWKDYAATTLNGNPLNGKAVVDTAATPSWYPYYYRAKAIGAQDLANGLYSGESGFSNAQAGYSLPADPPLIQSFKLDTNVNAALVTLTTDLPAAAVSPVGPALVEVLQLIPDPSRPGKMTTKQILSSPPDKIAVGTLSLPAPPPPPPKKLPLPIQQPKPVPPPAPALRRSAPDLNGHWTLYALLPYTEAQQNRFLVRLTDPLSRRAAESF